MDIMKPKALFQRTITLVALLILIIMYFMPFQIAAVSADALKGCNATCGDVEIPYPFGIGGNCSLPGFEVSCKMLNNGSLAPFLFNDIPLLEIGLDFRSTTVVVEKSITYTCNMSNTIADEWNLSGTPYQIINQWNRFTVIGCDVVASITYGNEANMSQGECITMGCFSPEKLDNGFCTGFGCCYIDIYRKINYYQVSLQFRDVNSSNQYNSSQCSYVAFGDDVNNPYQQRTPVYLDWSMGKGNKNCKTVQDKNACISDHSFCNNSYYGYNNREGYVCFCSLGFDGNPYLDGDGGCLGRCLSLSPPPSLYT